MSGCTGGACVWVCWWSMMSGCAGGACVWVCWWSMCLGVLVEHDTIVELVSRHFFVVGCTFFFQAIFAMKRDLSGTSYLSFITATSHSAPELEQF